MKSNAFEAAARYVYPALRRRLVEILYERGFTQTQIAELLHITQSAVSRYLKMNRGALIDVKKFIDVEEKLRDFANEIVKEKPDEYAIHARIVEITIEMLGKGYVCSFHSKVDPEIDPKKCRVCIELFGNR
ncbi:transcriptional regulator [Thermococci archaeon]|uniref:transcriptional regulator n=1 Tax=Palaeococcus sp. (in: euryarchaeotes) TaxID=2820298 RepID=UPI000F23789E|nr:transcriptional regulator [Palaeococcus sp. (in: euryarchaeotes)]MCD6559653.1 transcriptional regulator [Palaeococcus sp. (in: euryarchaeotes)]RLF88972.1 MAG: transcriptional regulator [Thermococci archaeon]